MKLTITPIVSEVPEATTNPMHRVVVVDCSGSMSHDLPKLRTMLKNKLPTMVADDDILSIIWFSGKNQFGTLFEGVKLSSPVELSNANKAIDRFLVPVGMTGFVQPLEKVSELADKSSLPISLFFMSDGGDNINSKKNILGICTTLGSKVASSTFVDFGYYADSKLIQEMAEETSGAVVLAEDFPAYELAMESMFKSASSTKKIKFKNVKSEFVVGNLPDGFVIAKPDAVGTVTLPSNTLSVSQLVGTGDIVEIEGEVFHGAYMVSALIIRSNADLALQVASLIGDVDLYTKVQNSFSKQDYAATVSLANEFGSGKKKLYSTDPKNTNLLPDENAYNVLTLLMDLADTEGNYLDISHEDFKYTSIGDKREITPTSTGFVPVFKDKSSAVKAPIAALKFDEDRPNISILVKREGTVEVPENEFGFEKVDTFIWRNYTIVRDGIINVRKLPVVLCKSTYDLFSQLGVVTEEFKVNKTFVIDTSKFPIINRSMVGKVSAEEFFKLNFDLYKLRTKQKVLKVGVDKPEFSQKFLNLYGELGTAFLKELGITDSGFSPKSTKGESVDPYMAKVLEIKMSSLSGIPKVDDVVSAIEKGKKLTPSQTVMSEVLNELKSVTDTVAELVVVRKQIKEIMYKIVMTKFGIIVGKSWFTDMVDYDHNSLDIDFNLGKIITCQAILSDKEV